jgi:hypothetical protein
MSSLPAKLYCFGLQLQAARIVTVLSTSVSCCCRVALCHVHVIVRLCHEHAGVSRAMNMNASSAGPRAPLQAVALMAHRAVETLRWLQPLAKVTRVRSIMCDIALLSPSDLIQLPHQQQQQQGAQDGGAAAAAAEGQGQPTTSSSSSRLAAVEQQLCQVVRDLVVRLAAPNPAPCRKQVGTAHASQVWK